MSTLDPKIAAIVGLDNASSKPKRSKEYKSKRQDQDAPSSSDKVPVPATWDRTWFDGSAASSSSVPGTTSNDKNKRPWVEGGKFTRDDNPVGLVEESSFQVWFPKWREAYLKKIWPAINKLVGDHFLKVELNLVDGNMLLKTTKKTWDPYIIIKARDVLRLVARGVEISQASRILEDDIFCELIKIHDNAINRDRFVKRRNRLTGPDGSTLKALELLTKCHIFLAGKTACVIGPVLGLKQANKVITECMNKNIHPIFHIKQLMVKRELMKNEKFKDADWSAFLPQFKKTRPKKKPAETSVTISSATNAEGESGDKGASGTDAKNNDSQKKKKDKKKKKSDNPFPPAPEPRKEDLEMESGEYFLSEDQKHRKRMKKIKAQQQAVSEQKQQARFKDLQPPPEVKAPAPRPETPKYSILAGKQVLQKKRPLEEPAVRSAADFIDSRPTKKPKK